MADGSLLRKLEFLWQVPIFYTAGPGEEMKSFGPFQKDESPLAACPELVATLIEKQDAQDEPVIYQYAGKVYFFCVKGDGGYYVSGPFCTGKMTMVEIHRFYKACHFSAQEERHPRVVPFFEALNFISLLCEIVTGEDVSTNALLVANHMTKDRDSSMEIVNKGMARFEIQQIEADMYHHTYMEERSVLDAVREGDVDTVGQRVERIIQTAGRMSADNVKNARYLVVCTVSLATREAIAGGVSPAEAYKTSDYLLNQIDDLSSQEELDEYTRKSMILFAQMVADLDKSDHTSSYTEQVKNYVAQNYHHKIYISEIAETVGLSQGHLSRVFHEDTGMKIQDYILKFRVERAANLLKYSDASIAQISSYVCFQSQSHFGSVFKQYTGMTPGEYRLKNFRRIYDQDE